MSHKISLQEAKEKLDWEKHCQELNKAGLPVDTTPRWQKKQKARQTKYQKFVDMLMGRGGHYTQKEDKKEEKNENTTVTEGTT